MLKANPLTNLYGKSVAALGATGSDYFLAGRSGHSFQKSAASFGFSDGASECSFHCD